MQTTRPDKQRILIVDDNAAIHQDFQKALAEVLPPSSLAAAKAALFGPPAGGSRPEPARVSFEIDSAAQGEAGLQKVQAAQAEGRPYAVAFIDMRMPPGWDGLKTTKMIWQSDAAIQVVLCTAYSDYSLEQINDELGASDRLLLLKKPFDNVEVRQLASALSEKWNLQREAALKLEELERMVQERTAEIEHALLHDKLTGLPNRTLLTERLTAAIERRKRRPDFRFALLFLDLDRFKIINDSLGHETGDLLLIETAQRLTSSLRASDMTAHSSTPARLGGDEFIVLLEDLREEADAARVGDRLLQILSDPYVLNGQKIHITTSIGIATSERGYDRAGDMIRDADTAMYRAKASGRARYALFDRQMHEEAMNRLMMENALRKAVQDSEFTLHYQPIIHLATGGLAGFEALIRWTHPIRGPIQAAELISVAEDTGLILPIGLWVLGEACRQLKTWQQKFPEMHHLVMSVNLSRKQLIDADLVDEIDKTIKDAGIDPRRLVLEITESTVLDDPEHAVQIFQRLQQMGIWLHLDDFGTGHSSLSCLYQFPLSGLKIDRAFLRHITQREEHVGVLQAIVTMAKAFKLQVVAEGVETAEQVNLLRGFECDHAQGYFFDQPRDVIGAEAFIRRQLTSGPVLAHPMHAAP